MKPLAKVKLLLFVLIVAGGATVAQVFNGTGGVVKVVPSILTVRVTANGRPVEGAVVRLMRGTGQPVTHELAQEVVTNAKGVARCTAQVGETYHLTASVPNFDVEPLVYDFKYKGGAVDYNFVVLDEVKE